MSNTREILGHVEKFRGTTIVVAPSGIGPIDRDDLGMFLQDADLLTKLGIMVLLVDYRKGTFWSGLELPQSLQIITVTDQAELVSVAIQHSAAKLCLVAGTDRIAASKGRQLDDVSLAIAEELLSGDSLVTPQSRLTLACAVKACQAGVPRVHIFNVHNDGALLDELFTNLGAGTMIYAGTPHKKVRGILPKDTFRVCALLRSVVPKQTLTFVRDHLSELRVFTMDGDVHGVARILIRDDTLLVLTMAYSTRSNTAEVLERLLRSALEEAATAGAKMVAIPTDEIPALMRILPWFTGLGFSKGRTLTGAGRREAWIKQVV